MWTNDRVQQMFARGNDGTKWDRFYEPGRSDFESTMFQRRRDLARAILVETAPASARVLDLGCGAGPFTASIADLPYGCIGSDLSMDMLSFARERLPAGAPLLQSDSQALPIGDRTIDVVVSLGMISYVPDRAAALGEIHRILHPDGSLIITYRNQLSKVVFDPARSAKRLLAKATRSADRGERSRDAAPGAFLRSGDVATLLHDAGFRIIDRYGIGYGPIRLRGRTLLPDGINQRVDRVIDAASRPFDRFGVEAADVVVLVCRKSPEATR